MSRHGENIRKRKDGRWEARCMIGRKANGKAQYKYIYGKTYYETRELKNKLVSQQDVVPSVSAADKVDLTFKQLLEDWLIFIRSDVKESTYSRYVFLAEKHILTELGEEQLSGITSEKINQFASRKLAEGKLNGKGGLSPKTVASLLSIIKLVLNFGIEKEYYCFNNVIVKNPKQNKPEIMVLSEGEQQKLEQYLFENMDTIHLGILLSLYAGLRIGEVSALKWEDFDFINNTVTVQRTILRIQDLSPEAEQKTKVIIGRPKTECSNRVIPLPSFLMDYIRLVSGCEAHYILTGNQFYMEPRRYYQKYKRIMENCNLERFNYHALRHTFATRCIENNFDVKSLSEILGHANVTTTMQKYVHPSMNLKRQHMEKLETFAVCDWKHS